MKRFRELFQRYHLGVFRYLRRSTGSADRAQDLTQEVFLRALRSLPGYRAEGRERAWIFTLARNVLLNDRRDLARQIETQSDPEPSTSVNRVEPGLRLDLESALASLPALDRDVFLLREIGGLGYAEIAKACEISPDSVRSRIYRARMALRATLDTGRTGRVLQIKEIRR